MDGVFRKSLFSRQVEFIYDKVVGLRIFFNPFTDCYLIGVCFHIVENSSSRFVLICADVWTFSVLAVFLFTKLPFPDILMHFGTSYPAVGRICSRIIAYSV